MAETIELPHDVRACPKCDGEARAQGATRGGGWRGHGVRIQYTCRKCDHHVLLGLDNSYSTTTFGGALLLLLGVPMVITFPAPENVVFGIIIALLGGGGVWSGLIANTKAPVLYVDQEAKPSTSEIKDKIYLSGKEVTRWEKRERYLSLVIFSVLIIVIVSHLLELIAWTSP